MIKCNVLQTVFNVLHPSKSKAPYCTILTKMTMINLRTANKDDNITY